MSPLSEFEVNALDDVLCRVESAQWLDGEDDLLERAMRERDELRARVAELEGASVKFLAAWDAMREATDVG